MIQTLYSRSQERICLLIFILLSSLSSYVQAQNGGVTTTQSFSYTGQIVTWTVPTGVTSLTIEARGAEGGTAGFYAPGKGAIITGTVQVTPAQQLSILVGQQPGPSALTAGGGGGSFVVTGGNPVVPLIIAGGGGGNGGSSVANSANYDSSDKDGQAGNNGGKGTAPSNAGGAGGTNGGGGRAGSGQYAASGGGGLLGNGSGSNNNANLGGKSFVNGGTGGAAGQFSDYGGFGGGGAGLNLSDRASYAAGGGGGGYSGGGASSNVLGTGSGVGGGGGSYNAGTNPINIAGANSGNGLVLISYATPSSPPTISNFAASPNPACVGQPVTFSATIGNTSGSYSYTFTNTGSGGQAIGSSSDQTIGIIRTYSGPIQSSYTLRVVSNGQETTAGPISFTVNALPTATLSSDGPLTCVKTSVTLTAGGGTSYAFSAGATQVGTTNQATVTTAGVYSVTVSSNGCSSVASTTVTGDQAAPTVSVTPTSGTLTCASPTLTLTANTSASTLRWSNGQTTPSITVNTAGAYSVTATGANGCSATSNAVRIESSQSAPPATLVTSGGLSCAVSSVTLTANSGDWLSYRFSSGATQVGNGNTATVNVAGTYSVTVTNTATGCTNIASTVVNQDNSQPTVTVDPTSASLTCGVPSVTLTATTSAPSIRWSTGQTTASISLSVAGTYSVTVTSANGCMAMAQATVSGTTDAPTAPTLSANPAAMTTNQPIIITASGCSGGMINWALSGGSGQAGPTSFTLSQPGNYSLSASCTLNGCTSPYSPLLALQIRPGGFAITGVNMVNCQLTNPARGEYQVQFTPQYTGQNNDPIHFAVVNELAATTAPAPYTLRLYTDNPVITLVATQASNGEARFAYNWLASCQSGTSPNQPPTTTGIPSQTIVQGQGYQLQLTNYFSDPDGQALSFQASSLPTGLTLTGSVISGTPSQTGVTSINVTAIDPGGLPVSTSFQLTVSPMPVTPPTGFAIVGVSTVSCQVISAGERRLTFTPQYAGVSGAPISFSVVNELVATTSPGPYSLNLYTDNPTITLSAQQGATVSTYRYNWLSVCNPAARVGSGEASSRLQVKVLGNPVAGNTAEVEISGVTGQPVQLDLVDLQGKPVHAQHIEQAGAVERVSLPLGASNGVLLLQVSTPTQRQQLKLLRTN